MADDGTVGSGKIATMMLRDRLVDHVQMLAMVLTRIEEAKRDTDASALAERLDILLEFVPPGETRAEAIATIAAVRGWIQFRRGDVAAAIKHFERAFDALDQLERWVEGYELRLSMGVHLRDAGAWMAALSAFDGADALDRRYGVEASPEKKYRRLISLTGVLIALDRPEEVVGRIETGLEWMPFVPSIPLAALLLQLGNYRLLLGRHGEAQDAYRRGGEVCAAIGDEPMRYRLLGRVALAHMLRWQSTGDQEAGRLAVDVGREAFDGFVRIGDAVEAVDEARRLCRVLDGLGRAAEAIDVCRAGAAAAARAGAEAAAFTLTAQAGFLSSHRLQRHAEAAAFYLEALRWECAAEVSDRQRVAAALATLFYAARDLRGAAAFLQRSCQLLLQAGATAEADRERVVLDRVLAELAAQEADPAVEGS